ncbi:DUF2487 family protein [Paenibacillus marinisediminis]
MKFSELTLEQWEEWKPYLDTCLLPVTGLSGIESPVEAALKLEDLRDWLDLAEGPFHGRIVTYPAYHYAEHSGSTDEQWKVLNAFIQQLKQSNFRYVVIMSSQLTIPDKILFAADLVLTPNDNRQKDYSSSASYVNACIQEMWTTGENMN